MGTDDPAERDLIQGLIKLAAADVHGVRGNPAGVARNLEGARDRLGRVRRGDAIPEIEVDLSGPRRRRRLARLADRRLADRPDPVSHRPDRGRMEAPMNPAATIPTIDVAEAERRLREDPAGPLLVDVREADEFEDVRAPGAVLVPMSSFAARAGELPADRPLMLVCHLGGRSAAAAGFLIRRGGRDVVNVAGGMDAWERAGLPVRRGTPGPGRGRPPG